MMAAVHDSVLRVVVVYPELLGTYGDGGNGVVLTRRAQWRGYKAELLQALSGRPIPCGDLYCLGGGEDGPEVQAAHELRGDRGFLGAVERGAVVLAVCAGYQIVGNAFPDATGHVRPGAGLLDVETFKHSGRRMVGEVVADPFPAPGSSSLLPTVSGFENHGGATRLGNAVRPFARVASGGGNGWGDGSEGAWGERVLGTYLHGPFLARNPAVADLLLGWAVGDNGPLPPLDDEEEEALRAERLHAASLAPWWHRRRWRRGIR